MKDQLSALNLLEEIETAILYHPTSRQSSSFSSRVDSILKRLAVRDDPASPASHFPRPDHPLFPDQRSSNEALMQCLTLEIGKASQLAEKVDKAAKKYRTSYEAVKRVQILLQDVQEVSITLTSIINKFKEGVSSDDQDDVPPDLISEDPTSHFMFLALLPSLLEETTRAIKDADERIKASPAALCGLELPGIDKTFREKAASDFQKLTVLRAETLSILDSVSQQKISQEKEKNEAAKAAVRQSPQKRRHPSPSRATIVATSLSESKNELPQELPEVEPSPSVIELSFYAVIFVHIIPNLSRIQMFYKLLPLQRPAIQHLRVLDLHLFGLRDMIHCQRERNPKLPVPASILPVVICSVATLALWVVHTTM